MSRVEEIQKIEGERGSKVICYLTGDRNPFATSIGDDVLPILFRHLELVGEQDNIDLFLFTRGGDMVVPVRIVKLIRNYCKKFSILIPYKCHSAGTLISLGADEIVMTKLAELTPVDPTSQSHPFNPKSVNPINPAQQVGLPVSVEDVSSYLFFARDVLKAQEPQIVDLYSKMSTNLHPLALGNVYRAQKMIKIIAKRLLSLHFKNSKKNEDHTINKIIKEITEDICVHNYPIYRDEAASLGLTIHNPKKAIEDLIWNLFQSYSEIMKLSIPFNQVEDLGANDSATFEYAGAFIESEKAEDAFKFTYELKKLPAPVVPGMPATQPQVLLTTTKATWTKIR